MNLYTEEQVLRMMELARFSYADEDNILFSFTPFVLPTDEEIEKTAKEKHVGLSRDVANYRGCFEQGAKWMRDKILNK